MGDKDDMPLCLMWKRGWCFGNSLGIGNTCPRRHYYLPRDVPPPQQQRAPAESEAWFSSPISPVNVRVLRHELTEVKTQLDADTGEERTWSETVVKEVIDLTGEGEEEQAAVNEALVEEDQSGVKAHNKRVEGGCEEFSEIPARLAGPAEEPLGGGCGPGDEEIAANQPDDIGKDCSNEEEVEGHKTIRAEEEGEEALSLEILDTEEEDVEKGDEEGEQRNQADFEEVVESVSTLSNTNASIEKVAAHSSFSSDTTEPWEGEGGSEEEAGENQGGNDAREEEAREILGGDGGSASLGHDEGTPSPGLESSQMHRLDDGVSNKLDLEEGEEDILSSTKKTRREEDIEENEEPIRLLKKRSNRIESDDEDVALVVQQSHDEGTPNLESSQMQMNAVSSKLDLEEGEEDIVSPMKKTRREDDIEENEEPIRLPKKRSKRFESDDEDDADMVVEVTQTKNDFPRAGDMEEGENNNCRNIISQLSVGAPFSLHLVQMANSASTSKDSKRTRETSSPHSDKGSVQMEVGKETQSRPGPSTATLPRQYTRASQDSSDDYSSEGQIFRQGTSTPKKDFPDLKVKEVRVQLTRMATPLVVKLLSGGNISVSRKGVKPNLNKANRDLPKKETPVVLDDDTVARGDECIGCGETFANLRRHQRLNHDLPCPDDSCERSFTSEEQLRRHMAKDHLKFANGGECMTCGERFPEDLELAIHISQCGEPEESY